MGETNTVRTPLIGEEQSIRYPVAAVLLLVDIVYKCNYIPVAVKALLSVGHGTPVLVTGRELSGGSQLSFDLGWGRAMKHHWIRGDMQRIECIR